MIWAHICRFGAAMGGAALGPGGLLAEWCLVLVADSTAGRERAAGEVGGLVGVGAGAGVEVGGVPVPGDGEQAGAGEVVGHGSGVPVGQGRVVGGGDEQDRVG